MAGSLVALASARPSPLNGGTPVPGAQLWCYDAGTTTKRAWYTTSALSVALSNPLVADANGRFAAAWINPDSGAYKLVLGSSTDTDPPASPFWTEDNIPAPGPIIEGNFTGTVTGHAADPTGTVYYRIIANAAGTGKVCRLWIEANIAAVSNSTAMTLTGLPAAVRPSAQRLCALAPITNNGVNAGAGALISAAGVVTFLFGAAFDAAGFTAANSKGLISGWALDYPL